MHVNFCRSNVQPLADSGPSKTVFNQFYAVFQRTDIHMESLFLHPPDFLWLGA